MTLRELGIVPVFPPREDVFVGDVYAYEINPDGEQAEGLLTKEWRLLDGEERRLRRSLGMSPRLHRINLNDAAEKEYKATLAAPATPDDYNSILGNQALAAAQQKVADAKAALKVVTDRIKAAQIAVATAKIDVLDARRAQEDAGAELASAKAAVIRAKAAVPETSAEQQSVREARDALRVAQQDARDAKTKKDLAQAKFDRLAPDSPDLEAAQLGRASDAALSAEGRAADAQAKLRIAEADLAAAKAKRPGVAAAEASVRDAEDTLRDAQATLVSKQRVQADAERALAALNESTAAEQTAKKAAVALAKSIRDAIAKAGERLLFAQPRDSKRSVFLNSPLAVPGDPNDLVNARVNRLRLVGFPEFATASFTKGDLSALIPIEAFSLGLNASAASARRVTVKVPAAESYAVPITALIGDAPEQGAEGASEVDPDAAARLQEAESELHRLEAKLEELNGADARSEEIRRAEELLATARQEVDRAREALDSLGGRGGQSADAGFVVWDNGSYFLVPKLRNAIALQFAGRELTSVHLRIPTEVFYARALDVSVFYGKSYGVRARLTMVPEGESDEGGSFDPSPIDPTGAALLRSVEASLGKTMSVPGGAVQLVGVNETSIGLRRVFDRPVAIGFRGLTVEVELKSGRVTGGVSGGMAPTKFGPNNVRSTH